MSNVLLITYMFPPAGGVGTPRALAYAQYLPREACRISVLAPTKPALRDEDPGLSKLVPADVPVYRARNFELSMAFRDRVWKKTAFPASAAGDTRNSFSRAISSSLRWLAQSVLFPDPQVMWVSSAFREACRLIKKDGIDTVIITVPPFSLLKLSVALRQKFPGLKIITDFRDEWLGYYLKNIDRPTENKVRRAHVLERRAIHASTYVSAVTESWVDRLRQRYSDEPSTKFFCTPNGYDPEMFRHDVPQRHSNGKIVVTYFGTVHGNRIYSPANYLAAVESLPAGLRDRIETRFIGRVVGDPELLLGRSKASVRILGFMSKQEGIQHLHDSDFLLLIATDATSHAGKLFDYLGAGRPILALSPKGGEIDRLLKKTRSGRCADPWDTKAIREMIISSCERLDQTFRPDVDAIGAYSWPRIFERFAEDAGLSKTLAPIRYSATIHDLPVSVDASV